MVQFFHYFANCVQLVDLWLQISPSNI